MDPKFIKSDGRVHPRYTNILRTGRTSCNSPNIQQLPSREKTYPLKLMYRAPEGAVLCATDFSFIELTKVNAQLSCGASHSAKESELLGLPTLVQWTISSRSRIA